VILVSPNGGEIGGPRTATLNGSREDDASTAKIAALVIGSQMEFVSRAASTDLPDEIYPGAELHRLLECSGTHAKMKIQC